MRLVNGNLMSDGRSGLSTCLSHPSMHAGGGTVLWPLCSRCISFRETPPACSTKEVRSYRLILPPSTFSSPTSHPAGWGTEVVRRRESSGRDGGKWCTEMMTRWAGFFSHKVCLHYLHAISSLVSPSVGKEPSMILWVYDHLREA